jgi:hypothetical protein
MTTTTADPLEDIREIYELARECSHETRRELAGHIAGGSYLDPRPRWEHVLASRAGRGVTRSVSAAGNRVTRAAAAGQLGGNVRHAVRSLVRAVEELASFAPVYDTEEHYEPFLEEWITVYVPTAESVAGLDQLRERVFTRLVELDEALREYPDPLGRVLAVMKRTAARLLPTAEAARVCRWVERLERDAG